MAYLTPEERIGQALGGKYLLERLIGLGGMGAVFAARHLITDRPVAVKVVLPNFVEKPRVVARFMTEAQAAGRLRHPNVVEVIDVGRADDGTVFMVLELLEGESLGERIKRGPLSPTEALESLLPVMDALATAHVRQIVHRDLKPDNIFLSRDYHGHLVPKLLDFGIAKLLEGSRHTVTNPGTIMGTPYYMAPEQAASGTITGAVDVWSVGVVMYEALTASLPFRATTMAGIFVQVATGTPTPLRQVAPHISPPLAKAIHRAINRDPEHRLTSMPKFIDMVIDAAEESGINLPYDLLAPGSRKRVSRKEAAAQVDPLKATESARWSVLTPTAAEDVTLAETSADALPRRWKPIAGVLALCTVGALIGAALLNGGDGDTIEAPPPTSHMADPSGVVLEGTEERTSPLPAITRSALTPNETPQATPSTTNPDEEQRPREAHRSHMRRRRPRTTRGAQQTETTTQPDQPTAMTREAAPAAPMMTAVAMGFASDTIENSDEF